jgi:hypothetical protein
MPQSNSGETLRALAAVCRRQAAGTTAPDVVELLQEMASKYDRRAERLERMADNPGTAAH